MSASDIAHDGTVLWTTLVEPGLGFGRALARRRTLSVVIISTVLSLGATALVLPTVDVEAVAGEKLRPDMTVHEKEQATETAVKLFRVTRWASAALKPVGSAFLFSVVLWLAFWIAGARATYRSSFTVAAYAMVPSVLYALLLAAPAIAHAPIVPDQLPSMLPTSLASVAPPSWPPPAQAAARAFDLFTLWTMYLAGAGMMKASGATRLRTFFVIAVLFLAYVGLFNVVPSTMGGGFGGGGPR